MKTKSKIEKQIQKKTNSTLVSTIIAAKKKKGWLNIAAALSGPKRIRAGINLSAIAKESGKVVVPGKVLSQGEVNTSKGTSKKVKVIALNFSEKAKEKLLKAGCEVSSILDEIKSNPEAKDIKVLKTESKDSKLSKTKGNFNK